MKKETEEKLACSLTAETTKLIPFLPYLLQDLWALGSVPEDMVKLIKTHIPISKDTKILDIACGKGAVSINIARSLGIKVYGFDLMPDFVECAKQKAKEMKVDALCHFVCADVNDVIKKETNYDCVIMGGAGNILGDPQETLNKLLGTIKPNGFILIDEAYLPDGSSNDEIKYKNYDYWTHAQWLKLFKNNGLKLVEERPGTEGYDFENETRAIAARAKELSEKYPDKQEIFDQYVQSQTNECTDLESNIVAVNWLLQKL